MMTTYIFSVERAKSGRAKCKGCNQAIPKDSVRLGIKGELEPGSEVGGGGFSMAESQKWFHMNIDCVCKFRKASAWWQTNTPDVESVRGLESDLEGETENVEELLENLRNIGVRSPSTAASSISGSVSGRGKRKERSEATSNIHNDDDDDLLDGDEPSPSARKKSKPNVPTKLARATGEGGSRYTAEALSKEQVEKIKIEMLKLRSYKNDDLKKILKQNEQILSGKKEDLIERCAEGLVLGAIPKCPTCSKRVLRFDRETGNYSCPGSFEGGQMVKCKFSSDDVDRLPWSILSEDS